MGVRDSVAQAVLKQIDREELANLIVALSKIESPIPDEKPACDHVFNWLTREGFAPEKVGLYEHRYNVLARLRGKGSGQSIIFNSHLDVVHARADRLMYLDADARVLHDSWIEDGRIWGASAVNCKGPMGCWLIAAKAIKRAGVELNGDIVLTAVVGEVENEPVDEFQGPLGHSQDVGARYVVAHGAIGDFALVGEATNFKLGWVEAGKLWLKITAQAGPSRYTPYVARPTTMQESSNAIVRAAKVIEALEEWAYSYQQRYTREYAGAVLVPKASIGAIRGGLPYKIYRPPEVCHLYVDVRLNPDTNPVQVEHEIRQALEKVGVPVEIKPFAYRRGYEAKNIAPYVDAVSHAHVGVFGTRPTTAGSTEISMWRDTNAFNEVGIPSLTYGPGAGLGGGALFQTVEDVYNCAKVYALTALEVCSRPRP